MCGLFHFIEMKITTPKTTSKTTPHDYPQSWRGIFLSYDHSENECHIKGMILENNEKSWKNTMTFTKIP